MKKVLDKLINAIKFDKRYVFFCVILVLIGIICGSLFIVILNSTDKNLVIEYIESFIESIKNNTIDYTDSFKNTLIINYAIVLAISIFGLTCFLSWLNTLILFYRSFIIGFIISSFILTYKIKGIVLSLVYVFPHMIFNILIFSLLTACTLKLSFIVIKHIKGHKDLNIAHYFSKYLYTTIFIAFLITISSIYETFCALSLIKFFVNIL